MLSYEIKRIFKLCEFLFEIMENFINVTYLLIIIDPKLENWLYFGNFIIKKSYYPFNDSMKNEQNKGILFK